MKGIIVSNNQWFHGYSEGVYVHLEEAPSEHFVREYPRYHARHCFPLTRFFGNEGEWAAGDCNQIIYGNHVRILTPEEWDAVDQTKLNEEGQP